MCWLFLGIAVVPLVAVVVYVVAKGLPAWSVDFFTHSTTPEGIAGGGVWNAIVGTVVITASPSWSPIPVGLLLRAVPGRVRRSGRPRPCGSPPTS